MSFHEKWVTARQKAIKPSGDKDVKQSPVPAGLEEMLSADRRLAVAYRPESGADLLMLADLGFRVVAVDSGPEAGVFEIAEQVPEDNHQIIFTDSIPAMHHLLSGVEVQPALVFVCSAQEGEELGHLDALFPESLIAGHMAQCNSPRDMAAYSMSRYKDIFYISRKCLKCGGEVIASWYCDKCMDDEKRAGKCE